MPVALKIVRFTACLNLFLAGYGCTIMVVKYTLYSIYKFDIEDVFRSLAGNNLTSDYLKNLVTQGAVLYKERTSGFVVLGISTHV